MFIPSIVLIALCASTSIFASPFKIPGFGSKMTPELRSAAQRVLDNISTDSRPGLQWIADFPGGAEFSVLQKAANAKLPKSPSADMIRTKKDAADVMRSLKFAAGEVVRNQEHNPLEAEMAKQKIKAWDDATGKVQWKHVAALGGTAVVAGGVGGIIGAHHGDHQGTTDVNSDNNNVEEASAQSTVVANAPVVDASTTPTMYTPSIVLIVLCASASVLAAPFKFPKIFGSKMTPELADAETTVANWMRESTSGRLQQPGPSEYAILHKVANARVAKDAGRALKTAQTDAEGLIKQLRIHDRLRDGFRTRKTRSIEYRKQQLAQLGYMLQDNHERFEHAFMLDFRRHVLDSHLAELGSVHSAVLGCLRDVDQWAKETPIPFNLNFYFMSPKVRKEPKGVVLLISPFNYPVLLGLGPMTTAIAAGNAVMLKPSELNIATAALLAELFPKYLDPDMFAIVNGSIKETQKLLELRWDHIMFTGSIRVGRIVAEAAAKHLTPTTLELGGKSPVIIDGSSKGKNIKLAARRLAWGRMMNCGQTCVAPDYILVPRECQDEFVREIKLALESMYPSSRGGPRQSDSYSRIISIGQFDRIKRLLDGTKGKIVAGGQGEREERFLAPTIRATMDSPAWMDLKILYGSRYPPFRKEDVSRIKLIWGEGYIPYPRLGEAPSLRMRMGKVPWIKLLELVIAAWALKSLWWDRNGNGGWVKEWVTGFWAGKLRLGWA
ncbi:hypothetical protein FRB98_006379 [Tulasnella sp. 332]|nr:hypothetical protein FRB98_006379 [Tulasnella sp. 332]